MPLLPLLLFATQAFATAEPVGSFGATVDLPSGWKREVMRPDLGPDQFHGDGVYMTVQELRGTFLDPTDVRLQVSATNVGLEQVGAKPDGDVKVDTRTGALHAEQPWSGVTKGVHLSYEVHVFGRGGLGYRVLLWSGQQQRLALRRAGRHLASLFRMPRKDSAWAQLNVPTTEEGDAGDYHVRYAYPAGQLEPVDAEARAQAFVGLHARDRLIAFYMLMEHSDSGVAGMLDSAVEKVSSVAKTIDAVDRQDTTVDGRPGRIAYLRGSAASGSAFSAAVAVIPVADDLYLDIRFLTYATFESRRPLWEGLVGSIDILDPVKVDAFPIVEPKPDPVTLTAAQRTLLEGSTLVGMVRSARAWRALGGDLYLPFKGGVDALSLATGETRSLPIEDEDAPGLPALRGGALYLPLSTGAVVRVRDGNAEPAGFDADALADAGEAGLLVARGPRPVTVTGFTRLTSLEGSHVLLRTDAGAERDLLVLPDRQVTALAVSGGAALLETLDDARKWGPSDLEILRLDSGETRSIGRWLWVGSMDAAPGGWLVNGAPEGGASGVYRVGASGERTLLVSGRHEAAFALDGGDLLLATRWKPPAVDAEGSQIVALRVPASAVASAGARFDPFTAAFLQQLGLDTIRAVGAAADPMKVMNDPSTIKRFVDAASRASEARMGVPLPRDAVGVDHLFEEAAGEPGFGQEGYLLLAALLTDNLLGQGAVWAAGAPATRPSPFGRPDDPTNDHAEGYEPLELVRSTLLDSEGWWNPAENIPEQLQGRTLVLGVDPDAIRARVDAANRPGMDSVAGRPVAEIVAWLAVEPHNEWLRDIVYRRLAAAGRAADLPDVAAPFLAGKERAFPDLHASLAGRFAHGVDATSGPGLIADLRTAIAEHPNEAALYMLLGSTYAAAGGKDAPALARACFQHVVDLGKWEFHDEAEAELLKLGG